MIRFDQRSFDVHETERVFKKIVHPTHGHNSIRLVDKDGIPLRSPNSAALSRLQSSYILTPRGVPARKSSHSYSGQIAKDKMHNLVNSMDTNSYDMASHTSVHNYGLSSAGSSRHYIPRNLTPKQRTFGSGPPRSVKPMAKSASSERSRFLTVSPDENLVLDPDSDKWNGSPQGKRLEKEWVALSQCRALKRSSEIVSHRVDRMYFMTGNKLKLQQKYHIEDDELQHLKELSQARASSRASRWSSRTKKGDVYRPDRSATSSKTPRTVEEPSELGSQSEHVNGVLQEVSRRNSKTGEEDRLKETTDPTSNMMVSQKPLTPKPSSRRSPLQGWSGEGQSKRHPTDTELMTDHQDMLHEDQVDGLEVRVDSLKVHGGNDNVKTAAGSGEQSEKNHDSYQNNEVTEDSKNGVNIEARKNFETSENNESEETKVSEADRGETDKRPEEPVFVTEGNGSDTHSVQNDVNSENKTSEEPTEKKDVNGEIDIKENGLQDKYDTD